MSSTQTGLGEPLFEVFGNYLLLQRISQGGMAAIFLARPYSSAANGRLIVIKRILPQIAHDPEFVQMFRSEIQVSMGFNHPNIVQTYDFGQTSEQLYIAMEFIEGKSIRQIMSEFAKWDQLMPIGVSVSIAAQASAGLHYAHTFKNPVTGVDLRVIHRDVSPQNIIITYDGNAKLIDFGIAKANNDRSSHTRTGTVKGKICYLSPEQTLFEPLDGRSDVFTLCTVLWEMLTGQKLFAHLSKSDDEIMATIRDCENYVKPPSSINPKVPTDLDAIVMKGMRKSPRNRYENASELQKELRGFLLKHLPGFGYLDVGKCLQTIFVNEPQTERERIRTLNATAQQLLADEQDKTEPAIPAAMEIPMPKLIRTSLDRSSGRMNSGNQMQPMLAVASADGNGFSYIPMSTALFSNLSQNSQGLLKFPKVTRAKLLFAILFISTILLIQTDRQYLLLQRFFMPTAAIRLASEGFQERPLSGVRLESPVRVPASESPARGVPGESVRTENSPAPAKKSAKAKRTKTIRKAASYRHAESDDKRAKSLKNLSADGRKF